MTGPDVLWDQTNQSVENGTRVDRARAEWSDRERREVGRVEHVRVFVGPRVNTGGFD